MTSILTVPAVRQAVGVFFFAVALALGIGGLDQAIATLVHGHLAQDRFVFDALTHIIDPLLPLSSLGITAATLAALAGWRPGVLLRVAVTAALAVLIAVTLKDQAKYAFGRLWPETWVDNNPSWIGNGQYGFFPFHGGRGWASFPSGHMTVIAAPALVAARGMRVLLWPAILATALVAVGLLGADYHFFSDILAGTLLGAACGWGAMTLVSLRWTFDPTQPIPGPRADEVR